LVADEERLHATQYFRHPDIFPDGQFVLPEGSHVVGTTTMRYDIDPGDYGHVFSDVFGGGA
jgi:hypothetical protein